MGAPGSDGVVKDQPAGAKRAPVLAVGGKGRWITQGFPQGMWMAANGQKQAFTYGCFQVAIFWSLPAHGEAPKPNPWPLMLRCKTSSRFAQ